MIKYKCKTCGKIFYDFPCYKRKYCSKHCAKKNYTPKCAAWNKGTKGVMKPNQTSFKKGERFSQETEFKKGKQSPRKNKKYPQYSRENCHLWKGGISIAQGYKYIYDPNNPRSNQRGYVQNSHIVAEKCLGRPLTKSERVHHINEKKDDDKPENLFVFKNQSSHAKHHRSKSPLKLKSNLF